jgi:uridine phosphorylase
MKILASELPRQSNGAIYHIGIMPDQLADTIILVGDPGRVPSISAKFDSIEFKQANREIVTHTGTFKGNRITVLSTGMGTDNIDIILNELDALANIDFEKMEVKNQLKSLRIVRIGTCGILQGDIPVNSYIAGAYGFGFDGLLQFYQHDKSGYEPLVDAFIQHSGWGERLPHPYCFPADPTLLEQICFDMVKGITASAPGFYGPQGRVVRGALSHPDLNARIETFQFQNQKFTNLEMECSAVYGLGHLFGHRTLTVCVGIANRVTKVFSSNYHSYMDQLVNTVLERLF